MEDQVQTTQLSIREPPTGFFSALRYLGPGLILSAAIVGSGELIATTALGAQVGFALLWVILFGCLVKVAVQLEYGRYAICHGEASFQAWNREASGNISGLHWSSWIAFIFLCSMLIGQAGVLGGASQVAAYTIPAFSVEVWTVIVTVLLGLLVSHGRYRFVELTATGLNFVFIFTIGLCVFAVQKTPYAVSLIDLREGLILQIPPHAIALAIGAFGITGVGSGEIFTYPYWCLEKGYARWTGPRDGSEDWNRRARGWIRVMTIDSLVSLFVYTLSTFFFYILGATVLRSQETLADGNELIFQLSLIFTETIGERTVLIFMLGAFTVLFSTVFANTAGYARLWTDLFVISRLIQPHEKKQHLRSIQVMSWILPVVWGVVYLTFQRPLFLVVFMGISNALFLIVVAYKALIFRYRYVDSALAPSRGYDAILCLSVLSIGFIALWALKSTLAG